MTTPRHAEPVGSEPGGYASPAAPRCLRGAGGALPRPVGHAIARRYSSFMPLLAMLALTACGDTQNAAYLIAGPRHSLTLTRQQAYLGSAWESELVVANFPDCQRRYPLKDLAGDSLRLEVHRPQPGVFILNGGKRWYVTETKTCRLEEYKDAPPAPGVLVGSFQLKDGALEYRDAVPPAPTPAAQ